MSKVKSFVAVTLASVVLSIAACTDFGAPEQREVVVSAQKLSELLGRRLSVEKKVLDVLYLRTGKPEVVLDPQSQRLRVDLDLTLTHPFSSRPLHGRAGISGGLAFDADTRTVMLTQPRIEKLDFDAVPQALRDPIGRLGAALGSELLDQYPLVTLEQRHLTALGREYRVLGFDIVPEGLKVILRARP
jgi:hypothetical protein